MSEDGHEEEREQREEAVKVVVVGNSGVGKSFLANVLLGHESFAHSASAGSVTSRVEWEASRGRSGRALEVYNTPGLIEADAGSVGRNKRCIREAFETHAGLRCLVLFVFSAGTGGRVAAEDVSGWEAVKGFLQPEARRCSAAIAFVVNQVPALDSGPERDDYQAGVVRTLAAMCGATSFSGRTLFVDYIPCKRTRSDFEAPQMRRARATLLGAIDDLLPRATHIMPAKNAVIELEHDRLRTEIAEIGRHLDDVQRTHQEETQRQAAEHSKELEKIKKENECGLLKLHEANERQLETINEKLKSSKKALQESHEALEKAQRQRQSLCVAQTPAYAAPPLPCYFGMHGPYYSNFNPGNYWEMESQRASLAGHDIMDALLLFLVLGAIGAFYMGFSIGGNDAANSIATIIGSRSLPYRKAMLLGMCCEFLGGVLIASFVASTIRKGIADPKMWETDYERKELANGMLSTLLASGTFVTTCSLLGMPVSTTHAVVSGLVTFGLYTKGPGAINGKQVRDIAVMWVASPVMGFVLTLLFWKALLLTVHRSPLPPRQAVRRWLPVYVGLTLLVIVVFLMYSGLKALKLQYPLWLPIAIGGPLAFVTAVAADRWLVPALDRVQEEADKRAGTASVQAQRPSRLPAWLRRFLDWLDQDVVGDMMAAKMSEAGLRRAKELRMDILGPGGVSPAVSPAVTPKPAPKEPERIDIGSSTDALEGGADQVSKEDLEMIDAWNAYHSEVVALGDHSFGKAFAVMQMFTSGFVAFSHAANAQLHRKWTPPFYIALLGATSFVVGIAVLGRFVNNTMSFKVSAMSPSSGWASDLAVSIVMVFASIQGYPISSTHTVIGSITAIGFLNYGLRGVRWKLLSKIVASWVLTFALSAGATLALFKLFQLAYHEDDDASSLGSL
eukprot:m51a1_g14374 hypothetical protein (903) ;mRNA; f:258739-266320